MLQGVKNEIFWRFVRVLVNPGRIETEPRVKEMSANTVTLNSMDEEGKARVERNRTIYRRQLFRYSRCRRATGARSSYAWRPVLSYTSTPSNIPTYLPPLLCSLMSRDCRCLGLSDSWNECTTLYVQSNCNQSSNVLASQHRSDHSVQRIEKQILHY